MKNMFLRVFLLFILFSGFIVTSAFDKPEAANTQLEMCIVSASEYNNKFTVKITFTSNYESPYELHIGKNGAFNQVANYSGGTTTANNFTHVFTFSALEYGLGMNDPYVLINCALKEAVLGSGKSGSTDDEFFMVDSCIVTVGPCC